MEKEKIVTIYTDGSSLGNPGPGGWGAVLIYGKHRKELSGGFKLTTNNRMEILAVIEALKALKHSPNLKVKLHTDSKYVVDTMTKGWLQKWKRNGWTRKGPALLNVDLWKILDEQVNKFHVEFIWVKAHVGISENERCDVLAKEAAGWDNLPTVEGYEPKT